MGCLARRFPLLLSLGYVYERSKLKRTINTKNTGSYAAAGRRPPLLRVRCACLTMDRYSLYKIEGGTHLGANIDLQCFGGMPLGVRLIMFNGGSVGPVRLHRNHEKIYFPAAAQYLVHFSRLHLPPRAAVVHTQCIRTLRAVT